MQPQATTGQLHVPTPEELMWPVINALKELHGSATLQDLLDKVVELQGIPEPVQHIPHAGNRTKLAYNLAWALSKLKKWGAVENDSDSPGVWAINERGLALSKDQVDLIPGKLQALYREAGVTAPQEDRDTRPEPETWRDDLLEAVHKISPAAFERLSKRILMASGFESVEVTGGPGDGGIDGVGILRLGQQLVSFRVCFQCKRYQGSVPISEVLEFRGALSGKADRGLFITTGRFTGPARDEAARFPVIDLIDGDALCDILKDRRLGVVPSFSVDHTWFESL